MGSGPVRAEQKKMTQMSKITKKKKKYCELYSRVTVVCERVMYLHSMDWILNEFFWLFSYLFLLNANYAN